jgi:outer membrane protein OmpA-like peptidoglycan-associated protein
VTMSTRSAFIISTLTLLLGACAGPTPGPDKQFEGELTGALSGAGAGAVTGFQLGVGTGPGAFVGAGFGAVAGGIQGAMDDLSEAQTALLQARIKKEKERAAVHEILQEHYQRRLELFPSRDIFPADIFFSGDDSKLCRRGVALVGEIAKMNKFRAPWSKLVIASYVKSSDPESDYAKFLSEKRAKEIGDYFVKSGIEARRVEARGVIVDAPIVVDPTDHPARYSQAIEIILAQ